MTSRKRPRPRRYLTWQEGGSVYLWDRGSDRTTCYRQIGAHVYAVTHECPGSLGTQICPGLSEWGAPLQLPRGGDYLLAVIRAEARKLYSHDTELAAR